MAGAAVLAGIGLALINLMFTAVASESWWTLAIEPVDVIIARTPIKARVAGALIHVGEAASVIVTGWALTAEPIDHVNAPPSIGTRLG